MSLFYSITFLHGWQSVRERRASFDEPLDRNAFADTYILSPPGFPTNILLDAVAFHHFLLPGAFATATALATLAALAALEVASALARLAGLTLGSLEKATLAL